MNKITTSELPAIQYTIWSADLYGHRFHVKLRIENPLPNGQILQMPAWIPGSYLIRDFSKHIESIEAFVAGDLQKKLPLERINNDQWRLPVSHNAIEVLTTVYAFDSSVRAAYLDTERAFFNATSLCLGVQGQENLPCSLAITRPESSFAAHWSVQTGLRAAKTDEHGFGFYLAQNYDDLLDHPVAMGEFQIAHWQSNGVSHAMAVQGCAVLRVALLLPFHALPFQTIGVARHSGGKGFVNAQAITVAGLAPSRRDGPSVVCRPCVCA